MAYADGTVQDWHSSKRFNDAMYQFHESKAKFPKQEVDEARERHTQYMETIRVALRQKDKGLCSRLEYTGSSYDGLKLPGNLEFDVMMIIQGGNNLVAKGTGKPGYVLLSPKPGKETDTLIQPYLEDNQLSAQKLADKFFGYLQTIINADQNMRANIKLRRHGPAIQLDVSRHGRLWYTVDMVPAYEVTDVQGQPRLYVTKQLKDSDVTGVDSRSLAWRKSSSLLEKGDLTSIDSGSGFRKYCVRILKKIIQLEASFKIFTSYHIKMALLHVNQKQGGWKREDIGLRVTDIMRYLLKALQTKKFPHFYFPEVDILPEKGDVALQNTADRLVRMLRTESVMMGVVY